MHIIKSNIVCCSMCLFVYLFLCCGYYLFGDDDDDDDDAHYVQTYVPNSLITSIIFPTYAL